MEIVLLVGRVIFGLYFAYAAVVNLTKLDKVGAELGSRGVPRPRLAVVATAPVLILGGLSVALGYFAEAGAVALIVFLVPASVLGHRFWGLSDPGMAIIHRRQFERNMALIGACLLIIGAGSGPYSLG